MLILVRGPVSVFDRTSESAILQRERLQPLDGLTYDAEKISDYFGKPLSGAEVVGGALTLRFDGESGGLTVVSEFSARKKLSAPMLRALLRETTGQWADGIGEGCAGAWKDSHGIVVDFTPNTALVSIEQVESEAPPPRESMLPKLAFAGQRDKVAKLIAKGEALDGRNVHGFTALHLAILGRHAEVAHLLIEAGVDTRDADRGGSNALSLAAKKRLPTVVAAILARGHAVDEGGPEGLTPLMWAANSGDIEMIDLLLAAGAKIDAQSTRPAPNGGQTALMFVTASQPDAARRLLARGANAGIRNHNGETAAQSAARNKHQPGFEVLVALLEAVAKY